jgi:hypothetical protein
VVDGDDYDDNDDNGDKDKGIGHNKNDDHG